MKNLLLTLAFLCCSICLGQTGSSIRRCIDVVKSDDGKYYALYSDNTWEESTYATSELIKAMRKKDTAPTKTISPTNTYGIASSSPTKATSSPSRTSGSSRSYHSSRTSNTRKSTSRTYIRGPRGGCYYINSNGGKTYVDRSMCN
ncbi:hypothetical protein [Sphingobacterium paucimobilis]|uniref:hypothetical protein n=1 Tax=Sphingobacterium paucimobilis TaxID=1385985 RepID=UPI0009DC3E27|nr:hypothetical protein [Sphingobacterium paucimobilis]